MAFRIGQKIVCVDAKSMHVPGHCHPVDGTWPIEGYVYTVRNCFVDEDGDWIVWLNEIARNQEAREKWGAMCGYAAIRFRPVHERKTDISIFTEMLKTDRVPALSKALSQHD